MAILTVRLTEEEERLLARRSRRAGMKKASFVRKLIREQPFETAADVLGDAAKHYAHLAPSHVAQLIRDNLPTLSDPPRKPRKVTRLRT